MASEPYCAEAPSRSTSTRSIAAIGMALISTAAEPRPMLPLTLIIAEVWRRLPLTSTSTWSGDRPRSCAGRMPLVPSVSAGRGKFSEGRARDSAVASSVVPVDCSASGVMMSMADCDSATVRSATRVPVTITVSRVREAGPSPCWAWAWKARPGRPRAMTTAMESGWILRFMPRRLHVGGGASCGGRAAGQVQRLLRTSQLLSENSVAVKTSHHRNHRPGDGCGSRAQYGLKVESRRRKGAYLLIPFHSFGKLSLP